jgi:transposase
MTEKIREILKLKEKGLSSNFVSSSLEISRQTVQGYVKLCAEKNLNYQKVETLSDSKLLEILGKNISKNKRKQDSLIDYSKVYEELQQKGVTEKLLYQEYRLQYPELYSYSTFCRNLRRLRARKNLSFRKQYEPGDKVLSDYSGLIMMVRNPDTGEDRKVQIFVSTLAASNYIFCEAVENQSQECWIGSHIIYTSWRGSKMYSF